MIKLSFRPLVLTADVFLMAAGYFVGQQDWVGAIAGLIGSAATRAIHEVILESVKK